MGQNISYYLTVLVHRAYYALTTTTVYVAPWIERPFQPPPHQFGTVSFTGWGSRVGGQPKFRLTE